MIEPDPSVPSLQPPAANATAPEPAPASNPHAPNGMPPMPIAALAYAYAAPRITRPGIITSIGVIGIVAASLSALASLMSGCQAAGLYFLSTMSASMPAPTSTASTTPSATGGTMSYNYTSYGVGPGLGSTSMPSTALTASQVSSAMQAIQWTAGAAPTQAQLSALRAELSKPAQQLILSGNPPSTPSSGVIDGMGNAYVTFPGGGVVSLNPQGQSIPGPFAGNPLAMFKISKIACGLTIVDAFLSLGMAIFLLVAAILILRSSPGSRRLHLFYAVVKIPLVLGGTAAVTWMYADYYASIGAAMPGSGGFMRGMAYGWGVGFVVVGLIYPIALLIALNTRRMREYFGVVPTANSVPSPV